MTGEIFKMSPVLSSPVYYFIIFLCVVHSFGEQTIQADDEDDDQTCPAVNSTNIHSNTEMLLRLAELCRYDRWTRPGSKKEPLQVHTRIYVYFLGSIEAHNLQFTAHILIRFRWKDSRLQYKQVAPNVERVVGEGMLRNHIWVPHVYLVNEHESKMMGADQHDVLFTIQPDGTILYSTRVLMPYHYPILNLQEIGIII